MRSDPPRPDLSTTLHDYPWVVLRFRCHYCARNRDVRLAVLAARFGQAVRLGDLLSLFIDRCPWNPRSTLRKPQKYGHKCGAYCPDLGRAGPPDLPPSLSGLAIIEGGKDAQLPASRPEPGRRRRTAGG